MERQAFKTKAQGVQLVATSLIMGLVITTGLIVFLRSGQQPAQNPIPNLNFPLWTIPVAMMPLVFILASVVGAAVISGGVKMAIQKRRHRGQNIQSIEGFTSGIDPAIFGVIISRYIVTTALVEGVGIIGTVVYLLEGNDLALLAPLLAVLWIAFLFPTAERLENEYEMIERRVVDGLEQLE